MILSTVDSILQIAFLYSITAIAVTFAFRIIGFPDLTIDGTFTLGAALGIILYLDNWPVFLIYLIIFLAGAAAGFVTSIIHNVFRVSKLLSGIFVMLMLYSISLRAMGTSNVSLMKKTTLIGALPLMSKSVIPLLILSGLIIFVIFIVWCFLCTELGIKLRATGDSETVLEIRSLNRNQLYSIGLGFANGIAAVSGGLIAEYQGFADISMGTGIVIISLAAVVIGEKIIRPSKLLLLILSPLAGMILYQSIIAIVLRLGFPASDLKISTALLAIIFIALDRVRRIKFIGDRQIGNRNI